MISVLPSPPDDPGRRFIYLHPGDLVVSAERATLTTVVGSCVAVFLWDSARCVGGLNHFLLPHPVAQQIASPRFGTVAIRTLLSRLAANGSSPEHLVAKVFGGAHIAGSLHRRGPTLGEQNQALAVELLREARIGIVASEVGGTRGRRVVCDTANGHAWIKDL